MRGKHNQQVTCKAVWGLVKSRMPKFVEPKQLVQSQVLVKRARLTAKRSAARPNGKSKATSESAQKGCQVSRLVGYMELKKNRTKGTSLDVTCENRHEVLRQKKLLIGCGGGFQQECSQSYSPVARWITEVALTLTDESQQYGNIEETSVIARTSRTCLNIWAGDHRQTPGGLKNTVECRLFRQKLLQRPLALLTMSSLMRCTESSAAI